MLITTDEPLQPVPIKLIGECIILNFLKNIIKQVKKNKTEKLPQKVYYNKKTGIKD